MEENNKVENATQGEEKNNKKKILIIIAIVVVIALIIGVSLKSCSSIDDGSAVATIPVSDEETTEEAEEETDEDEEEEADVEIEIVEVTDESGETVTNESGEAVTEIQVVSNSESDSKTTTKKAEKTTASKNESKTTKKSSSNSSDSSETTISRPSKVTNLKASGETTSSVKLSWTGVDCDGYQVQIMTDGASAWTQLEKEYQKTSITVSGLSSNTSYSFRVRSYNTDGDTTKTSDWVVVSTKTEVDDSSRKIKITIGMPSGKLTGEDTLNVYISYTNSKGETVTDELVYTKTVDADTDTVTFTTDKKYAGLVTIRAELVGLAATYSVQTDKSSISFIMQAGIEVINVEDD